MKLILNTIIACCIGSSGYAQLFIQNNAQVSATGTALITLQNIDLINNGTFSQQAGGGGKVLFTGSNNNSIGGTGGFVPSFDTIEIAKAVGAKVSLGRTCVVNAALKFSAGNMDVNGWNLNFGNTGYLIGENENNHIVDTTHSGILIAYGTLNAPNAVNIANFGAIITSSANLGQTSVLRKMTNTLSNSGSSINTVNRQYLISPANNTNLNATLRMQYLESELNSMPETQLRFYKSESPYIVSTEEGFTTRDGANNYVEKTGIQSFSLWSLGVINIPLFIDLTAFDATCNMDHVLLNWTTIKEDRFQAFELEYSPDAINWTLIASIPFEANQQDYKYTANQRKGFFRLAIVNKDGDRNYSDVIQSDCESSITPITCWPNPATDIVYLRTIAVFEDKVGINVFDLNGRLVMEQSASLIIGENTVSLKVDGLATGAYIIKVTGEHQQADFKIIKQ